MEVEQPPIRNERRDELAYRLKQQRILAQLGRQALQEVDFQSLLSRVTELCAQGLEVRFCKILEYLPSKDVLLMQAGVGWNPAEIGHATLGADLESPAGYAFHTGQSVLSNHLMEETRFRTPRLLADHGIKRAVNVLIDLGDPEERPYGVLEVDSPDPGQFDKSDVEFLSGCAGVLGAAIERNRTDRQLKAAVERQAMLMREMSHRVKNSLGVVSGLLRMTAGTTPDEEAKTVLLDAEHRVMTIAHVHNHLWQGNTIGEIDLGPFLHELCVNLGGSVDRIEVQCNADHLVVNTDLAIPLGLIVNELVTNAIKYAYGPDEAGAIEVSLSKADEGIELRISDQGKGVPADFDIHARRKSFGMRVVSSLLTQLNASMSLDRAGKGTTFVVEFDPDSMPKA